MMKKTKSIAIATISAFQAISVGAVDVVDTQIHSMASICTELYQQTEISGLACYLEVQSVDRMVFKINDLIFTPGNNFAEVKTLAFAVTNTDLDNLQVLQIIDEHAQANTALDENHPFNSLTPIAVDDKRVYFHAYDGVSQPGTGTTQSASAFYAAGERIVRNDALDIRVIRQAANQGRAVARSTASVRDGRRSIINQDAITWEDPAITIETTSSIMNPKGKPLARFAEQGRDQAVIDFKTSPNGSRTIYLVEDKLPILSSYNNLIADNFGNERYLPVTLTAEEMNEAPNPSHHFGGLATIRVIRVENDGTVEMLIKVRKRTYDHSVQPSVFLNLVYKYAKLTLYPDGSRDVQAIRLPEVPADLAAQGYDSSCLTAGSSRVIIDDYNYAVMNCSYRNYQAPTMDVGQSEYLLDLKRAEVITRIDDLFDASSAPSGMTTNMSVQEMSQLENGQQLLTLTLSNYFGYQNAGLVSILLGNPNR